MLADRRGGGLGVGDHHIHPPAAEGGDGCFGLGGPAGINGSKAAADPD